MYSKSSLSFRPSRAAACCAIALLAPFLGGATERWGQGVVLLLMSLLFCAWPSRAGCGPAFNVPAVFLVALAVPSFLPASWFGLPAWREEMRQAGVPLGPLLSPQPWISAECAVLLLAGVLWICWLSSQEWGPGERRWMAGAFVAGAAGIALIALVAFYCRRPVPFWHSERGFGPFPNRNQSGDFFAISGILAMGCVFESARRKEYAALGFAVATAIIGAALVMSYSRAGVALFFAGSLAWVASLGLVSRSAKWLALSGSLLMGLAAAFLLFGGSTLQRFQEGGGITWGFRRLIAQDAFALIHASPWPGAGLGNFEGVFALYRRESAMPSRILHPESDWLWVWSEMGLPAVLAVLAGAVILFRRIAPLGRGTDRRLRLAAAAGALVFVAHGLVDVSGHRLGSALPGLFVLGLALNNPEGSRESRWAAPFFRAMAALPGLAGAVWLFASLRGLALPGEIGVEAITQRAQTLVALKEYSAAEGGATSAIAWAPLDWELYFIRGMALADEGNWPRALDDFRRANLLESTSPLVTFEEGKIWLNNQPSLAVPAWRETLRRCPPEDAPQLYMQMLAYAAAMPDLRQLLRSLATGRSALELTYLEHADEAEARAYIHIVLQSDPALRSYDDAGKAAFFRIWSGNGGGDDLLNQLPGNPDWQPFAWRPAAATLAARGDYEGACQWVFRYLQPPALPDRLPGADVADLRRRLVLRPDDYAAGYGLYAALAGQNDEQGALSVVRGLTAQADCPDYFHFLEARLAYRLGDFPGAWNALQKYGPFSEGK